MEPVEGVADDDELEAVRLCGQILGADGDRMDVGRGDGARLRADRLGHVGFGVHAPYVREPAAQREGELAGAACQIEQTPAARRGCPA